MNFLLLKRLRVVLSVFFLLLLTLLFIDFRKSFSPGFYQAIVFFQFVPSLLKSITAPGIIDIGAIVVVVLTLLFGRIYCSVLCPLGILQDFVSWLRGKVNVKRKYKYHKAWNLVRYPFLAIVAVPLVTGMVTLLTLFDPYSLFGRIATVLLKPVAAAVNNLFAAGLAKAYIYNLLYRYDLVPVSQPLFILTALLFVTVVLLAFYRGRLYCNTICPVGTVLGLLSRFAIFRIVLKTNDCTKCGRCARVCKSECIEVKTQKIDYSRCVTCFNCLTVCRDHAMDFRRVTRRKFEAPVSLAPSASPGKQKDLAGLTRRNFLVAGAAGTAALYGFKVPELQPDQKKTRLIVPKGQSTIPEKKSSPVSPPGSKGIGRFNKICTGCSLCVSACPTKVLQPAFLEYGLVGVMQPHMNYRKGLCEFDCTLCSEVCPTGAILPLTLEGKHTLQIGQVQFEKKNCIVETEKTDCGACSEHCPTKAVHMVPYGKLFIPEIDQKICVGCGACEYACPTTPFKAIYVNGNPQHLAAEKPKTEKAKNQLKEGEFPF